MDFSNDKKRVELSRNVTPVYPCIVKMQLNYGGAFAANIVQAYIISPWVIMHVPWEGCAVNMAL